MAMLVELHLQGQDRFVYTCNHCRNSVETRFHCTVCEVRLFVKIIIHYNDAWCHQCQFCTNVCSTLLLRSQLFTVLQDFDLCSRCHSTVGHEHKMEQMGFGLDVGSPGVASGGNNAADRQASVQRYINSLVHAGQCRNSNCKTPACCKMKKVRRSYQTKRFHH